MGIGKLCHILLRIIGMHVISNLTVINTSFMGNVIDYNIRGFLRAIPLTPTFDPECMRIMGHTLRIIGTFLGNCR